MRKWFFHIAQAATVLAMVVWLSMNAHTDMDDLYPRSMVIVSLDFETDTAIAEDAAGILWSFKGIEDLMVGDRCACIMNTCGTELIYDDVIVSVRYDG